MSDLWKICAITAIIAIIAGVIIWLAVARANLRAELAQTRAENAFCQSANENWAIKAREANKALQKLEQETEKRRASTFEAVKKAENRAERYTDTARQIMETKTSGDECEAVKKIIDKYLRNRK